MGQQERDLLGELEASLMKGGAPTVVPDRMHTEDWYNGDDTVPYPPKTPWLPLGDITVRVQDVYAWKCAGVLAIRELTLWLPSGPLSHIFNLADEADETALTLWLSALDGNA